jgi:predicted nucleic acid-binding Zn ribbon protein
VAAKSEMIKEMSKYQKYADDGTYIFPHKHCPRCNSVMDENLEYCSLECQGMATQKTKRSKRNNIIIIGVMVAVVLVVIVVMVVMSSGS